VTPIERVTLAPAQIDAFIARHRLPRRFAALVADHYLPLLNWVVDRMGVGQSLLLGINGAQGSGKSTLADLIEFALTNDSRARVAVLSIDDFYLTRSERERLADQVHPLLITRGVPGTHDLRMLSACLDGLTNLAAGEEMPLPRFDKSIDDRADTTTWPVVTGPVDLIVLEGWCVGSATQPDDELIEPINDLERERDPDGRWRRYVNQQLAGPYHELFGKLNALVFLQVPNFDAVYRWRLEQERKLADSSSGSGIMDEAGVAEFIRYFERITRANLELLPDRADAVLRLDANHDCVDSRFVTQRSNSR
jgi:D-glycerate 3-kinase